MNLLLPNRKKIRIKKLKKSLTHRFSRSPLKTLKDSSLSDYKLFLTFQLSQPLLTFGLD
jgi:hypothetical protein